MWPSLLPWFVLSATGSSLPFITTWSTNTSNQAIVWPTISAQSLVTIDWGDNTPNSTINALTNVTDLSHVYATAGLYNVSVLGEFRWISPPSTNATKPQLVDIVSWGDGFLVDASSASRLFGGYSNLRVSASPFTQPVFLPGAKLIEMFMLTSFDSPLNWDLTSVTHINGMFQQTPLNKPINFSNTQGLLQCSSLFFFAPYFNQSFTMDIPNVTSVASMFYSTTRFNQPVTLTNSQKVTTLDSMFFGASSFNQPFTMDTRAVINMAYMFSSAVMFNQPLTFNTSSVVSITGMFQGASKFNQTLNFSSTANMQVMGQMFLNAPLFEQDLASWNTSAVSYCPQFCSRCGLPAFPQCSPCAGPKYTNERNMSVCYSLAPTSTPTSSAAPTSTPTSAPTTTTPTLAPSAAPSIAPSSSAAPSLAPSSAAPSLAPSVDLTVSHSEPSVILSWLVAMVAVLSSLFAI